jgi:6-pyruvoyltetrahydropterin/6-carboxytetrahydropterin synthase
MYSTTVRSVAAIRFLEEGSHNVKMKQLISREDGARKTAMHELIIGKGGYSTMHRHEWDHQLVVTEGRGLAILDGKKISLRPGSVLLVQSNEREGTAPLPHRHPALSRHANLYGCRPLGPDSMKLGVTEYIDCAHHLPGHERCGSLHGHTYQVDVFLEGDHKGGMLLDFADLKKTLRSILADYDHKDWNAFLEYPTVENIAELVSKRLHEKIKFPMHVRVWEGHGKWAEI